jgi:hypothetical protein
VSVTVYNASNYFSFVHIDEPILALFRYGSIYPSTGANSDEPPPRKCMIVGIIGSFEAFIGVLYAGFCTAVLFGKVIRSQRYMRVWFRLSYSLDWTQSPHLVRLSFLHLNHNV